LPCNGGDGFGISHPCLQGRKAIPKFAAVFRFLIDLSDNREQKLQQDIEEEFGSGRDFDYWE
jgi:hypothetical protein